MSELIDKIKREIEHSQIIHSDSYNPWYNLALEEYLLNNTRENEVILYLWQNDNTVVIGRNQNAWKECDCKLLEENEGRLARRLSGGGAVYHDLGNLNFTFIMDKNLYNIHTQLEVILRAVRDSNIEAEFSGRNDLVASGRKFSGNAFYYSTKASYHHGTILINTDFKDMLRYLQPSKEKIESKGIESIKSRVVNLKELNPEVSINQMKKELEKYFKDLYEVTPEKEIISPNQIDEVSELKDKYSSWDWRYGQAPDFDIIYDTRFDWGDIELGLSLSRGTITNAKIYSDAMNADLIEDIAKNLKGCQFKIDSIVSAITGVKHQEKDEVVVKDLIEWLKDKRI
ncbi:MAG: lipoate--protein ligase [Halanaerobiales bacterium]